MGSILIFSVLGFLFITSCASTSNQYLASEYTDRSEDVTLSILPIESDVFFEYFPGYIFGKLEADQSNTFEHYLPTFIERNSRADVKEVLVGSSEMGSDFELKSLPLDSESNISILGPKENTSVENSENPTRFTLILDQFNYQMFEIETGGGTYAGHEGETETRLKFETKYLIWDNQEGKPAAWGKVDSITRYTSMERDVLYQQLLDKAMEQIINKSPFL